MGEEKLEKGEVNNMNENTGIAAAILLVLVVVIGGLSFLFWVFPTYNVWQQGKSGQAKLREAEYSRQVAVEEAKARLESEKYNKDAEIVRAEGVAEANKIVADSITEQYIRYLWVKTLDGADKQIIYVPTEANLPLTEATRLAPTPRVQQ